LPVVLVFFPISLLLSRGRAWLQWLSAFILGAGLFWIFDATSAGWYSFYTLETLIYHERVLYIWEYWAALLVRMWPAVFLVLLQAALAYHLTRRHMYRWQDYPWLYLCFTGALILASWSIYFKVWTYDNGLMPATMGLALLSGLAYGELLAWSRQADLSQAFRTGLPLITNALILMQLALLFYNPLEQIPSPQDREQTQQFVQYVRDLPGKVWVFSHTEYGILAGKDAYFHSVPFGDIVGGSVPPAGTDAYQRRAMTAQVFQEAVSGQYFDWIIVDKLESFWEPYYTAVDYLPFEFYPVTGALTRPHILLARNHAE
jgi:hypothetical protein